MGGVGSGKTTLIKSELELNHPGAVVGLAKVKTLNIPEIAKAGDLLYPGKCPDLKLSLRPEQIGSHRL
jgi:hypothetical protein